MLVNGLNSYFERSSAGIGPLPSGRGLSQQLGERTGHRRKCASAHDLRRTFAVRLKRSGMPPDLIQQLMRHADFRTTEKYYLCDTIQEDAGRIREILTAPPKVPPIPGHTSGHTLS